MWQPNILLWIKLKFFFSGKMDKLNYLHMGRWDSCFQLLFLGKEIHLSMSVRRIHLFRKTCHNDINSIASIPKILNHWFIKSDFISKTIEGFEYFIFIKDFSLWDSVQKIIDIIIEGDRKQIEKYRNYPKSNNF